MSAIHKLRRPFCDTKDDPFHLGWRYVWQTDARGRRRQVQVPLTEEDVLFPEEEDFIVNNDPHWVDCRYLRNAFSVALAAAVGAVVVGDLRIAWGVRGVRPMGPDIAVIFNVRRRRGWGTFYVAEEGTRPTVVLEVTSQTTRKNDLGIKRLLYYRAGVPYYIIVDDMLHPTGPRRLRLLGYQRGRRGYERLSADQQGRLWLEPVGVWLGVEGEHVACWDREERRLGDYVEVAQRATAAEERVRQLEEELRRRDLGR